MSGLDLTEEEKEDLIERVTNLCESGVFNKIEYAAILGVCKAACERRMEEIDRIIGKPCDIVQ